MGAKKRPFYRVVVADQRAPRDGRFIENIGKYHPLDDPSLIEIDEERALHWLRVGAQPSSQVRNLMVKIGIWDRFVAERPAAADLVRKRTEKPMGGKLSKKAAAKAAAEASAPPAEEPIAAGSPADSAPDVSQEDASPPAEDTSDGRAGSSSDSGPPAEEPVVEASAEAPAEDPPAALEDGSAAEETTGA